MKIATLSIAALLIAGATFGQTLIGKVKQAELYFDVIRGDTVYVLTFKDATYKEITVNKTVSFRNLQAFKETIYATLEAKDRKEFTLGSSAAMVGYYKAFGGEAIRLIIGNAYVELTRKQLGKLFNEKAGV